MQNSAPMLNRNRKLVVAIILAINAGIAVLAWMLLVGPMRVLGSVVVVAEITAMWLLFRRWALDPLRYLTPIPPREGTSRSGQPTVEAFYRARDDVARRYEQ
jgi:hypothetical protein